MSSEERQRQLGRRWLVIFAHCAESGCGYGSSESCRCSFEGCEAGRRLLAHAASCERARRRGVDLDKPWTCDVPGCAETRAAARHYFVDCGRCSICTDTRNAIEAGREARSAEKSRVRHDADALADMISCLIS